MSSSLDEQINQLKGTITEIEAQWSIHGDATIEAALFPMRQNLADLVEQAAAFRKEPPVIPTHQRKLVIILDVDVVGSIEMIQHLDPGDPLEIIDSTIPCLVPIVESHSGHVTHYMGVSFKTVIGDPIDRENSTMASTPELPRKM